MNSFRALLASLAFAYSISSLMAAPELHGPKRPPKPAAVLPAAPTTPPSSLPSGTVDGTLTRRIDKSFLESLPFVSRKKPLKETVSLTYAGAFVDQKDDRKPTILVLADRSLPAGGWNSESDLRKIPFTGVIFWVDKGGKVFRADVCWNGKERSTTGIFDLKLDSKEDAKDLSGTATTPDGTEKQLLKAAFHAIAR